MRGLPLVAASGGHSSSRCAGLSLSRPLLLRSTGSRRAGSVIVAHGPSCSAACGIFPDQGSNPCPLHWQADSHGLCPFLLEDVGVGKQSGSEEGLKSRAQCGSGPVSGLGTASLTFLSLALHGLHTGQMCWTPRTELS